MINVKGLFAQSRNYLRQLSYFKDSGSHLANDVMKQKGFNYGLDKEVMSVPDKEQNKYARMSGTTKRDLYGWSS